MLVNVAWTIDCASRLYEPVSVEIKTLPFVSCVFPCTTFHPNNGVARIFFLGGGQFSVISGGRPGSVGGGVVAEIVRLHP